jgi:DNA primase
MSLSTHFLDEIRARTLLSGVIGKSTKLQRAGREWKACCPFHNEKTPSFYVNDEKGFYHCFGCQAHGDAIRWLTDQRGLSFMDAVKELADAAGMDVPAPDPRAQERAERASGLYEVMEAAAAWFAEQLDGVEGSAARGYLTQRGIGEATKRKFGFGLAPDSRGKLKAALKNFGTDKLVESGLLIQPEEKGKEPYDRFRGRLMFPIRDARGRCIAFSGRILGAGEPKYLNSPDTPLFDKGRTLFNFDKAAPATREAKRIVVVEGQMDVIALDQAEISEVVAPLGTALTEDQIRLLWRQADIPILCFDGDSAGRKAAVRAALRALPILAAEKSLSFIALPDGIDPDDLVREGGAKAFEKAVATKVSLDQLIWESEYQAADLETPEGRATLGRRLREHARAIADFDVRTQYLALYRQRLYDLFNPAKDARVTQTGKWLRAKRSVHPHLKAIMDYGMDKAVFAPAALEGLRAYPAVIASHAENVGAISVLLISLELKQVCREMLDAALWDPNLDKERLQNALLKAGLASTLEKMSTRSRVPFSFLQKGSDEGRAAHDLRAVLELLAATPMVRACLADATHRLRELATEQIFAEQIQAGAVLERLALDWADLLQAQAENAF